MSLYDELTQTQRDALANCGAFAQPKAIAHEITRLAWQAKNPAGLRIAPRVLTLDMVLATAGGSPSPDLSVNVTTLFYAVHGEWWTSAVADDPRLAKLTVRDPKGAYIFGNATSGIDVAALCNTDRQVDLSVPMVVDAAERIKHELVSQALTAATPGTFRLTWYGLEVSFK